MSDAAKTCNSYLERALRAEAQVESMAPIIQQLAWYYQVNDCSERSIHDALEVPVFDLMIADRIAKQFKLPPGPPTLLEDR